MVIRETFGTEVVADDDRLITERTHFPNISFRGKLVLVDGNVVFVMVAVGCWGLFLRREQVPTS